ncbi:hypothetical protein PT300_00295 [Enterobacteriaceae bacterium ESL0689]|nr:hypothetical protein [Enterobacteriaceae bacterium ESL0689]
MSDDAININEKYFRQIENILLKIESAYQNKFVTQGSLINKQFYAERDALFSQLKPLLKIIVENFIKLNKYHDVKQPVKLAVKPTAHPWDYTGKATRADGATDINSAEKATAFMNMGGWVALDISFTDTSNDIYHACTTGRERECGQVALKKYSEFVDGDKRDITDKSSAATICVAAGVPAYGEETFVCGLVVTMADSLKINMMGKRTGNTLNRLIYRGD